MKIDFAAVREDARRLGIILFVAVLLNAILEDTGNTWVVICLMFAGAGLMLMAYLERNNG